MNNPTLQEKSQFKQQDNLHSTLLEGSLSVDPKQLEKAKNEAEPGKVSFNLNDILVKYISRKHVVV